jgi:hypothetical protein
MPSPHPLSAISAIQVCQLANYKGSEIVSGCGDRDLKSAGSRAGDWRMRPVVTAASTPPQVARANHVTPVPTDPTASIVAVVTVAAAVCPLFHQSRRSSRCCRGSCSSKFCRCQEGAREESDTVTQTCKTVVVNSEVGCRTARLPLVRQPKLGTR